MLIITELIFCITNFIYIDSFADAILLLVVFLVCLVISAFILFVIYVFVILTIYNYFRDIIVAGTTRGIPTIKGIIAYLKKQESDYYTKPVEHYLEELDRSTFREHVKQSYIHEYCKSIMIPETKKITNKIFSKDINSYNYYAFEVYVQIWLDYYVNKQPVRMYDKYKQEFNVGNDLRSKYISTAYRKRFLDLTIEEKVNIIFDYSKRRRWKNVYNLHKRIIKKHLIAKMRLDISIEEAIKNNIDFPDYIGVLNKTVYSDLIENNIEDVVYELLNNNMLNVTEIIEKIYHNGLYKKAEGVKDERIVESSDEAKKRGKEAEDKRKAEYERQTRIRNNKLQEELREKEKQREKEKEEQLYKQSSAFKLIQSTVEKVNSSTTYSGVYIIVNKKTNDFYIGESQNIYFRKLTHLGQLVEEGGDHHSSTLQKDFNEYGQSAFEFYVLEKVIKDTTEGSARKRIEEFYIKEYNPRYNTLFF